MSVLRRGLNTLQVAALASRERCLPFWPPEQIENEQRARVRVMVRHAYETVPFYRRAMDEGGLRPSDFRTAEDLARLPLIDSKLVRENVELFCSQRVVEADRLGLITSGTLSHVTKVIYWDRAALLRQLAHAERDRSILTRLVGRSLGQRQLFVFFPESSSLKLRAFWDAQTISPPGLAHRRVMSLDLPLEDVRRAINTFRPHVVFSFGSFAERFFNTLADRRASIVAPAVWVYGGDTLTCRGRELIELQFGWRVYSTFQAVETGRLGFECERNEGYHLNVDLCATRLIADDESPAATGETGEVVISNLENRAMVLLNYRLNDTGVLDVSPCGCGRSLPRLRSLQGRSTELIALPDGRTLFAIQLEARVIAELAATVQNQIVIPAPGLVVWRIVPCSGVDVGALSGQLQAKSEAYLGQNVRVDVECVSEIPTTPAGKVQRVVRSRLAAGPYHSGLAAAWRSGVAESHVSPVSMCATEAGNEVC